ncbi:MAG: [FeFe] hydrogenase H-cluster maturation GTPase HydF [Muribaculaceae bacterium]|nr:[FeFe] hydrogenase H-cluster maturation GTPase HydF [Muribaculaceae bacterium]MDE6644249.1 [FeFe] hydrogenase H-cluster maturation GTPase HydF [Muribaculaceae bacterium]
MSLNDTPQSERLTIVVIGACNSGKSSVINMLADQEVSLVSNIAGTTTDPVKKAIELPEVGATLLVDTAGFDDESILGKERIALTKKALSSADLVLLLIGENNKLEYEWEVELISLSKPYIKVANNKGLRQIDCDGAINVDALHKIGRMELIEAILRKIPSDFASQDLLRGLVKEGDTVLLVMPQDKQAPKGRLILPQVQTIRTLLDHGCMAISTIPQKLTETLNKINGKPDLVITDSQVFDFVENNIPTECRLTSFSVLMAAYKGDIDYFVESAKKIKELNGNSRVLIAEACTHTPATEDIGRVKIPAMLRKLAGESIKIDIVSGKDFPGNVKDYDLVIHCGGCMFNRQMILSRVGICKRDGVSMTNYGITIAFLKGILNRVVY